jgi:hypothetical protein
LTLVVTAFAIQFGHLLETVKHAIYDPLVCQVHARSDLKTISAKQLVLHTAHINRKILYERSRPLTFLAREFILLDGLYPFILSQQIIKQPRQRITFLKLTTCRSKNAFSRVCCLSSTPCRNAFPLSSASTKNLSKHAMIPITSLQAFQLVSMNSKSAFCCAYILSRARALSSQVFNSVGKNPNMRSIAPRTSFTVVWLGPTRLAACRRK